MNLNRLFNEANDQNVEVKTILDIELDPVETGLKGSPTKVKKSFSKVINKQIELKEGTVEELAEEIVARLKSRNVL
jgi:electron transfer flavoprotein beta subunit